jgi:PAS domain S-box-containing protein
MKENSVVEQSLLFKAISDHSSAVIGAKDISGRYIYVNKEYSRLFKLSYDDFIGKTDMEIFPSKIANKFRSADLIVQDTRITITIEEDAVVGGEIRCFMSVKFPILDEKGDLFATGVIATDITDKNKMGSERELLAADREQAFGHLKTPGAFLLICASCKQVRGDDGYWNKIESYLAAYADVGFTPSICPDCLQRLYPDFED